MELGSEGSDLPFGAVELQVVVSGNRVIVVPNNDSCPIALFFGGNPGSKIGAGATNVT